MLIIIAGIIIDLSMNHIISNAISFNIFKMLNPQKTVYYDMVLDVPSHYFKDSDEKNFCLTYFIYKGPFICIKKDNKYISKDKWLDNFKSYYNYLQKPFESMIRDQIIIDGEAAYSLSTCNNCQPDNYCDIHIIIPSKQFRIEYSGMVKNTGEFKDILNKIKFIANDISALTKN